MVVSVIGTPTLERLLWVVTVAHKLAHSYSHVGTGTGTGTDIDGERWDTDSFRCSDIALVEGIAQYYTNLICESLNGRISGIFDAYGKLLKHQPEAYRTHLSWINDYSPEVVRMAIIEARRNKVTALSEFEVILNQASLRLHNVAVSSD